MNWEHTLRKAPPIENPRREKERFPNNDLSDDEYEKLFESHIDPKIKNSRPNSDYVGVFADDLGMSQDKLVEKLREFYTPEMGYPKIKANTAHESFVYIYLE